MVELRTPRGLGGLGNSQWWDMKYQHPQDLPIYKAPARERLERLAQFVEAVAPEVLTFTKWYGHDKGCPIGLAAATDSWFQAQGLGLRHNEILKECQPVYLDFQDWRAVTKFFALSMEDARNLFSWEGYGGELRPHPRRVAENICHHLTSTAPVLEMA